jgi:hypothetical protein
VGVKFAHLGLEDSMLSTEHCATDLLVERAALRELRLMELFAQL